MTYYVVVATWRARQGEEEHVADALRRLTEASRAEAGNRFYMPHQSLDDPAVFLIYEVYDDEAAFQSHLHSEHFENIATGDALPRLVTRERQVLVPIMPG